MRFENKKKKQNKESKYKLHCLCPKIGINVLKQRIYRNKISFLNVSTHVWASFVANKINPRSVCFKKKVFLNAQLKFILYFDGV